LGARNRRCSGCRGRIAGRVQPAGRHDFGQKSSDKVPGPSKRQADGSEVGRHPQVKGIDVLGVLDIDGGQQPGRRAPARRIDSVRSHGRAQRARAERRAGHGRRDDAGAAAAAAVSGAQPHCGVKVPAEEEAVGAGAGAAGRRRDDAEPHAAHCGRAAEGGGDGAEEPAAGAPQLQLLGDPPVLAGRVRGPRCLCRGVRRPTCHSAAAFADVSATAPGHGRGRGCRRLHGPPAAAPAPACPRPANGHAVAAVPQPVHVCLPRPASPARVIRGPGLHWPRWLVHASPNGSQLCIRYRQRPHQHFSAAV
ncbi:hypothetical protein H4R22_004937, partial [Coemansia sp. RSA 1290]